MTNSVKVGDIWGDKCGIWQIKITSLGLGTHVGGSRICEYSHTNGFGSSFTDEIYLLKNWVLISRVLNKHIKHYFGEV